MTRLALCALLVSSLACGSGGASLRLTLYTPDPAEQDPFEGVRQLRVIATAPGSPSAVVLVDVAAGAARLGNLPASRFVSVVVEGLAGQDAPPSARGYAPPVDLVEGVRASLPAFFAKVDRFAGNVSVSTGRRADLRDSRAGHAAVPLKDGRVFIAGGAVLSAQASILTPISRTEIYDPMTGETVPTASMAFPRAFHTATVLKDGRVLVAGGVSLIGENLSPLATAEIYDPATASFRPPIVLREPRGRAAHSATLLAEGPVLIAGGWGLQGSQREVVATAELFDPLTDTFQDAGAMRASRANHSGTLLFDGRILLAGGRSGAGAAGSTELYTHGASPAFAAGPDLPGPGRAGHAAVRLGSGAVLFAGGCAAPEAPGASAQAAAGSGCHGSLPAMGSALARVDLYEPAAAAPGRFRSSVATLAVERADGLAALLPGENRALLIGGSRADGSVAGAAEVLEQLSDGSFTRRTTAGELRRRRTFHGVTRLSSGLVLVTGGATRALAGAPYEMLSDLELFVP